MKKQFLSLSIASVIALAGSMPVYADEDIDCEGVLVQSRFALANCMVESALAIAAAAATDNGCQAGEWDIEVDIPENNFRLIPLQGTTYISGNDDAVELSGQSSALAQNNVNCRIETTESGNLFNGEELNYASGFNNFYVDAIFDRDAYELCIKEAVSSGDIALGDDDFDESNSLTFAEEDDAIVAEGVIVISASQGQGGSGNSQGPGGPEPDELSTWLVEERVVMPDVGETEEEGMEMEAYTNTGDCEVEVEAAIVDTASPLNPDVSLGLKIIGILEVEPQVGEE